MSAEDHVGFSFIAENSSDVICRAGLDMALHYVSPSMLPVLGWAPAEVLGKNLNAFVSAEDAATLAAAAGASHAPAVERTPVAIRLQTKDGALLWMEIRRRLLLDPTTGEPREYLLLMRALESAKPPEDDRSAFVTQVGGLSTHPDFLRDLERECSRANREASSLSLLRLDFNGFRQFHFLDSHRVGDDCLAKAAAAVKAILRLSDLAAHYLAEDMVIILPATEPQGAMKVAAKIRSAINALRSPRSLEGQACAAVSIGMSTVIAKPGGTRRMAEILLLSAEHALDKAQRDEAESLRHLAAYSARNADWKKSMPGLAPKCA